MTAKVFISSTGKDLGDYRKAAIEECSRLGLVPVGMEFFEAMGAGATEGSLRKLDEADLYVGIFAHRYGYVEDGYAQSVTELEFEHAGARDVERLCFVVDPDFSWPPSAIDFEHYPQLAAFKARVDKLIRSPFTDVNDFSLKLNQALGEWVRAQAEKAPERKGAGRGAAGHDDAAVTALREAYLHRVMEQWGYVSLAGVDPAMAGKRDAAAFKAAFGVLVGTVAGTVLKLVVVIGIGVWVTVRAF